MELKGIKEISKYIGLSESTVMDLIFKKNFPAWATDASTWFADTDKVDAWGSNLKNVPAVKTKKELTAEKKAEKAEALAEKAEITDEVDAEVEKPAKKGSKSYVGKK